MSKVRKLKYDNVVVENLYYKGNAVDKALYGNIVVYQNDTTTSEPDNTDPVDNTVTFELYPEFVPHNSASLQPVISSGNVYNIPEVYLVGNTNFFIRINAANTGNIAVTSSYSSLDYVYKFEDYGYGFLRSFGYNTWRGGSSATPYEGVVTFTPSADTSLAKSLVIHSNTDEDNTTFFRGLFTSRLIRVPAYGLSTPLTLQFYPYDFESEYYYNDLSGYAIEDNVGSIVNDTLVKACTLTPIDLSEGLSLGYMVEFHNVVHNGLETTLHISVGSNSTNHYRRSFLHFTKESGDVNAASMDGAEIHFVQEYPSDNRIYYGTVPKEPRYWESYATYGYSDSKYDYIFQYANSEIVTDVKQISVKASDNSSSKISVLCIPAALSHTISPNNYTPLSSSYLWGDQEYVIYNLTPSSDITYILQIG